MPRFLVYVTLAATISVEAADVIEAEEIVLKRAAQDRISAYVFDTKRLEVQTVLSHQEPDHYLYPDPVEDDGV